MTESNPEVEQTEGGENFEQVELASASQRIANIFLDLAFFYVFAAILGAVLGLLGLGHAIKEVNPYLLGSLLISIYYVPQEWLTGRTLAKLITGTQAIMNDGRDLTLMGAVGRTICRFIPFEWVSFLFRKEEGIKGWHDQIPGTLVITLRKKIPSSPTTWQGS